MADGMERAAQELLAQPDFAAALGKIESRLAERQGGGQQQAEAKPAMQVTTQEELMAQVAAEIKEQQRQRQEAVETYTTAADAIWALLERGGGGAAAAVPTPLLPAATTLLRFYHADAANAGPAPQLSREVALLLDPAARTAIAAHLTDLHERAATKAGPFIAALPPGALGEGVTPEMLPGGRTCRLLANADGSLVAGMAAAPAGEVPGLPGKGPLNLQTLAFGLAVVEKQVPGLHPLSLLMLDAGGERFVACSVCGQVPCLEHAHVRLMSRQLADSIVQRLAEMEAEGEGAAAEGGKEAA